MAWQNIVRPFGGYTAIQFDTSGLTNPNQTTDIYVANTGEVIQGSATQYIDDGVIRIALQWDGTRASINIIDLLTQTNLWYSSLTTAVKNSISANGWFFAMAIDTTNQQTVINMCVNDSSHTRFGHKIFSNEYENMLQYLQPPYTWQSVPSISGKNGILQSLVQIKEEAINDGEPVSEATVLSFDSLGNINIPSVIDEQMPVDPSDVTSVTATYLIPALENGTYEGIKLLVKKGSIPTSEEDADKVVNLDEPTSILRIDSKSVGNLDEDSHYYFVVKLVDEVGTEATSDPKDIWTSHSEGWNYDYTGQIQTFTAPKTGIYSLETWGAQGGDATDGTNSARGGYGAYAVGEVFLTQGDTLYINVGGQNGYGGGGNYVPIEKTRVLYNNGQYDSRYFGNNVTLDTSIISGSGGFTSCTCTFENDYIGIYGAGTTYWTERLATFLFNDAVIPENTIKIKVSGEYSFSNSYYCATSFSIYDSTNTANRLFNVNSESPTPWTNVQFETEIEKDFDKLKFAFRHDNNGSLSIKIKKIEITYLE